MHVDILAFEVSNEYDYSLLKILLFVVPLVALIIIGVIRLVRYLGSAGKEQKLMRLEVGKLADELEKVQKQKENDGGETEVKS